MQQPADYVLGGSTATYLSNQGSHLLDRLQDHTDWLDARHAHGLDPYSKSTNGPILAECEARDRKGRVFRGVNLASQDYLSLACHPAIKRAATAAIERYGVHSAGSPALMGNTAPSIALEARLAEFVQMADSVVFPTGWAAAYGAIRGLVRETDHVVVDQLSHASLLEGIRSATPNVHKYKHLSLEHLERCLARVRRSSASAGVLVVTESLFSMDADTPDLAAHQDIARAHDATLLVDVAHDLGCLGATGRGHLEAQHVLGKIDILMGSFSKTFASNGGFVAFNHPALKLALRYGSCPLTFSNAISPVQACTVLKALDIIESDEGTALRASLMDRTLYLRQLLRTHGFDVMGSPSPITPVILGDSGRSRYITKHCLENGALVNLVEFPAVARNAARFRLQTMAAHTREHMETFMRILLTSAALADDDLTRIKNRAEQVPDLLTAG